MTQHNYLTGEEAAALLGVSRRRLYRWMERGVLAAEDWTAERLIAKRDVLLARKPTAPRPPCPICGADKDALFGRNRSRPNGFNSYCRACCAARMRHIRH